MTRLYTRHKLASALGCGIDDWLILASSILIGTLQVIGTVRKYFFAYALRMVGTDFQAELFLGLGRHTFNVDPKYLLANLLLFWIDEIGYQIAITLIKSSILCFYVGLHPCNV